MSPPHPIHAGKTYLLSRRTMGRFFLFRPDRDGAMANILVFCLAMMAALFGMRVHAVCVLSTHIHLVVTDVRGVLPRFLHGFHRLVACATQCHRGWGEEIFNRSQTSRVELTTVNAIIDEMAYVIVNPVAAGAVRFARDWPGLGTLARDIGRRTLTASLPGVFFRPARWAASASVDIVWPAQILAVMSEDEARVLLERRVRELAVKARAELEAKGRTFLGAERCLKTPITRRATAYEVWGSRNPTFATGGADPEAYERAVEALRDFRGRHLDALERWRAGDRDVLCPAGTWKMRVLHAARVEHESLPAAA